MNMDTPDLLPACNTNASTEGNDVGNLSGPTGISNENYPELREQVIANFQKPNVPNLNVPEKIIICLDVCSDNSSSVYRLGDGTTFTPMNMLKRIIDFFLHSKNAINNQTEFAIVILKDSEPFLLQNFTNNLKDLTNTLDLNVEVAIADSFEFAKLFKLIRQMVKIPVYKQGDCILPPPYVVRVIVLYGRSNCIPIIPQEDPYFMFLKKQLYFYIDILLAHEEDCSLYRCEEIYDALQDLDNGYSYVFEVARNATKIHDNIAKLLAHPLQRPLQKNTDYTFGSRY